MHILLSVLGWILLALLALLLLALVLPVCAQIEYREGSLSVQARVFGLPFKIYPFAQNGKTRRPKKKKPEKTAQNPKSPKKKKKKAPGMGFEDIANLLGAAGTFVRRMYRMIHITDVILIVPIHGEDAAQTALACGKTEAWLSSMAALLQNYFDLRIVQIRVLPDFTNEITAGIYLSCAVGVRPIVLAAAGVHALIYLVRQLPPSAPKKRPSAPKQKGTAPEQKATAHNHKPNALAAEGQAPPEK